MWSSSFVRKFLPLHGLLFHLLNYPCLPPLHATFPDAAISTAAAVELAIEPSSDFSPPAPPISAVELSPCPSLLCRERNRRETGKKKEERQKKKKVKWVCWPSPICFGHPQYPKTAPISSTVTVTLWLRLPPAPKDNVYFHRHKQ